MSLSMSSSRMLSMTQLVDSSPQRCSTAFQSRTPRFTPSRTYLGKDPRQILADDAFRGQHPFQYQSPRVYKRAFKNGHDVYADDKFRFGVVVKEPLRPTSPFSSTLPRLPAIRPLEPFKRSTYSPELTCRSLTYLPLCEGSALR